MNNQEKSKEQLLQELQELQQAYNSLKVSVEADLIRYKKTEDTLRKSEEKYRMLIENSHDIIYTLTLEGIFMFISSAFTTHNSLQAEELLGKSFQQIVHPDDLPNCWAFFRRVIATGERQKGIEYRVRHLNGTWSWHTSNIVPIRDEAGTVIGVEGIARDITECRQKEELFKENETQLKEAQRIAKIGSWHLDIVNNILTWSDEIYRIFEIDPGKFGASYDAFLDTIHPDDRESVNYAYTNSLTTHTPYEIEHRLRFADGRIKYVREQCETFYDANKKPISSLGTVQEITGRKQVEQELIFSKTKLELALQASQMGSWLYLIPENKRLFDNQTFILMGIDPASFRGTLEEFRAVIHHDDWELVKVALEKTLAQHIPYVAEYRVVWPDESIHYIAARASLLCDENGNPQMITGINWDITERKQAEQDLNIAKERAEQSDRLKSAFLANMSHEIRTPMNGILGFAEILKEPGLTGEEQQKYINIIEKSGIRMLNIINNIVDISKIEAGLMKINLSESNINEQIDYICTFFKPEVEAKGMMLDCNKTLPSKEAIIKTDREKLYAIFTNLVKNAIKYSKDGTIEIGYLKKNETLEFYVKDTGIGIPKERLEDIFERFIQADSTDVMACHGAGLGLSITKAYVEMLDGKIWVESEEGVGSTFYFTLPCKPEPAKENVVQQPAYSDINYHVKTLKILIVEDDKVSEILIDELVKLFGREILHATTGIEAVEACRKNPDIDLILMDIRMPEMGGYEATQEIRKFNKNVVIIAQTAYGLSGDREKAIEAGCNDYISKPIKKEKLVELLKNIFKFSD